MFKHKTIFITGASTGLGNVLVLELNRFGANVAIMARNQEKLIKTANLCISKLLIITGGYSSRIGL